MLLQFALQYRLYLMMGEIAQDVTAYCCGSTVMAQA